MLLLIYNRLLKKTNFIFYIHILLTDRDNEPSENIHATISNNQKLIQYNLTD